MNFSCFVIVGTTLRDPVAAAEHASLAHLTELCWERRPCRPISWTPRSGSIPNLQESTKPGQVQTSSAEDVHPASTLSLLVIETHDHS